MEEGKFFREIRVLVCFQLWEKLLDMGLSPLENFPDFFYHFFQGFQVTLLFSYHFFPVPLVYIYAMVMVQEVILTHRPHVSAQALADFHFDMLECHALPLGGSLYHLGMEGVFIIVIGNMELNRGP